MIVFILRCFLPYAVLEGPDERDDDGADRERDKYEREADLDVVHEAELSGAKHEGVRRG